jgi:hypothetical protein
MFCEPEVGFKLPFPTNIYQKSTFSGIRYGAGNKESPDREKKTGERHRWEVEVRGVGFRGLPVVPWNISAQM